MILWQRKSLLTYLLLPFSWIFQLICYLRYQYYQFKSSPLPIPVIVVGNITMGGTGKTPLVAWLVEQLEKQGFSPGIVTRGYKGKLHSQTVMQVRSDSDSVVVGDEPLLLAKKLSCPVIVSQKRLKGAKWLMAQHPEVDIIICDDGLQHYALPRTLEIALVGNLGNGFCLPAGPLRESPSRLKRVDFIVKDMQRDLSEFVYQINAPTVKQKLSDFAGKEVHAVAGIGNPNRFFKQLRDKGIEVIPHPFADHYYFKPADLQFNDNLPILMTEKDAVKCGSLNLSNAWCVPLEITLPKTFLPALLERLKNG